VRIARPRRAKLETSPPRAPIGNLPRVRKTRARGARPRNRANRRPRLAPCRYNRRVIDEEKYALAHEERAIKAAQAREREKQRREIIDGGRARVEAARLQRRAAIERVEQCREYNADLADTVRYESSRIESHLAAGELETLRRNEAHASAARQGRMQALATSRESLFYDRVSRVQQARAPPAMASAESEGVAG